jgi:hypothetical protein
MAEATTLLEEACTSGIACLEHRSLLIAIAQSVSDGMTANELLAAACESGIACLDDKSLLVAIAEGINQGGGGGGGGTIQVYEGRDPAPPDDPTKAAVNFPTNGGSLTQWSVALQAWV